MYDSGFGFDAPPTLVLYHSELPDFEQVIPYPEYLINRAGTESKLKEFANSLRDFAVKSNFENFYSSQADFYNQIVDSIKQNMRDYKYINILENYYGDEKECYTIIANPLFQRGGYGPKIQSDSSELIYSILGAQNSINGFPIFGDEEYFEHIMLHEFSHSFVNSFTDKNLKTVNKSASLFNPIESKMKRMAYGNWITCVNEHLVRVNVARISENLNHNKSDILKQEFKRGFIYIYDLDSLMGKYEKCRDVYKRYEDFYPEIIKYFEKVNTKE